MSRVLFVGQKPETVDFSDPSLPPGFDAEKINVGIAVALVQRSATDHHSVFDGPLIWLLPSRLGNERISGVRRQAFG